MEQEYLAFVDEIGRTIEGKYLYRFDYCKDTEIVWGNYFNITPAIIVPNIQPDNNCLSSTEEVISPKKLELAKTNGCFSMQDCIDGIISICFSQINDDNSIYYNEEPLKFDFGEKIEEVRDRLSKCGFTLCGLKEVEVDDEPLVEAKEPEEEETNWEDEEETWTEIPKTEVISFEVGNEVNFNSLSEIFYNLAFERVDYIYKEAQYTIRGHIVDVFPIYCSYKKNGKEFTDTSYPFRISFIGNEIEEMFTYDLDSQEKIEEVEKITVLNIKYPDDE